MAKRAKKAKRAKRANWKDFTELRHVNEKTARLLWDHGFLTKAAVMKSSGNELAKVVGPIGYKIVQRKKPRKFNFRKLLDGLGLFIRFLKLRKNFRLGIYGPTNVGKTTLANRISTDFKEGEVGKVSSIPYETRDVTFKKGIVLESGKDKLRIDLADTPGFISTIEPKELRRYGLSKKEVEKRTFEACYGVVEAIKWMDKMHMLLLVFDISRSLKKQENLALLEMAKLKSIPFLIVANKTDIKKAGKKVKQVKNYFSDYPVVGISAKKGYNMNTFYREVVRLAK